MSACLKILSRICQIQKHVCYSTQKTPDKKCIKPSLFHQIRMLYKNYGFIMVPVHTGVTGIWIILCYQIGKAEATQPILKKYLGIEKGNTFMGKITVAIVVYKFSVPLRYAVSIGLTFKVIKFLRKHRVIEPLPKCINKKNK